MTCVFMTYVHVYNIGYDFANKIILLRYLLSHLIFTVMEISKGSRLVYLE